MHWIASTTRHGTQRQRSAEKHAAQRSIDDSALSRAGADASLCSPLTLTTVPSLLYPALRSAPRPTPAMRSCLVVSPSANPVDTRGLRVIAGQHVEAYTGSTAATALLRWMQTERNEEQPQQTQQQTQQQQRPHMHQQQERGRSGARQSSASQCLGPLVSKRFSFDRVWDLDAEALVAAGGSASHSAQSLYTRALQSSLSGAVEGRSVCVITHGCTMAGRTDVVCGTDPSSASHHSDNHAGAESVGGSHGHAGAGAGLVELALRDLYSSVQSKSSPTALFQLVASVVSIQTDRIRDLLYSDGTPLKIVTDTVQGGTTVAGGRRVRVRSSAQIDELVRVFRTGATLNPASHTVLTLHIDHLDLRMASDLSARGMQEQLHSAINRVATVQIAHMAGAEFALASSPPAAAARHLAGGSTVASAVAAHTAARCSSPSDPLLLAAQRWNRDPTVVKHAQLALLKKRRGMAAAAAPFASAHPPTLPSASASATSAINVPRCEVSQKSLARSFDCLERVLLQLSDQPSLFDAESIEAAADASCLPTPTSFVSFEAAATAPHVSYRSSALTWLLTDTLRAHPSAHVLLLGFVSPSVAHTKQSLHTLRFGARVHEAFERRRVRENHRADRRESAAMAHHAAAFTSLHQQSTQQHLGALAPEEFEAELVWDVQRYLRKHARHSPGPSTVASQAAAGAFVSPAAAATPTPAATTQPSQPATIRKEVQIHDAPLVTPQLISMPSPQSPAAAAQQKQLTPQQLFSPPLIAPARSSPSQPLHPASASKSPQTMTEALDAYLAHGGTPQMARSHVSFAPASAAGSGAIQSWGSTPAQPSLTPAALATGGPVFSLFSPRFEQVGSAATTPLVAPISQLRTAGSNQPQQQTPQQQPLSQSTSPRSPPGQHSVRSKTPSPPQQLCANPSCCPLASPASPLPAATSGASFASPLPSRLLDVLEVLRSGGAAPLAARIGSSTHPSVSESDQLAAEWPYHRDLVLHELTDQLAAWRSEQLQLQEGSSPAMERARMRQRVDELAAIFGDRIPVDALEALMREEESRVRQALGFASPEPPVQQPLRQQQQQQHQHSQQQAGKEEDDDVEVENAFQRGLGGANRRFVSMPAAVAATSKPTSTEPGAQKKPASTVSGSQQKAAPVSTKKQARTAATPHSSKIPVLRVQQSSPVSAHLPAQQHTQYTQPASPVATSLVPSAVAAPKSPAVPTAIPASPAVLTVDESWLSSQMCDVKCQMRTLTSQLQALASRLPTHSAIDAADGTAESEGLSQSQQYPPSPLQAADALYASAAAVHSTPAAGSSAATLSYRDPQGNVAELQLAGGSIDAPSGAWAGSGPSGSEQKQPHAQPAVSIAPLSLSGSRASSRRPSQVKVSAELSSALAHQARMQETLKQAEMLIASMQQQAAAVAHAAAAQS